MKISIVTVTYNSAATVEQTIQSVLSQTYHDVEYIIVDGLSTDGTQNIIEKYRDRIAHFISEKDTGIYNAMNKGIQLATGDVIGILNSDDLYKNAEVLSKVAAQFSTHTDGICTDVEIFDGQPENIIRYYSCTRWKPWMFRLGHQPPHPGFFVHKSIYTAYGLYNENYKLAADFDMLFRLIYKNKCHMQYCNWASVSMRSGGASQKSLGNISRANKEVNDAIKSNGYFSVIPLIWLKYPLKVFQYLLR